MSTPFYLTTPIYYPNDYLHLGNAYCSILADSVARYKKLRGFDVQFLTGTDEHGQKIERRAAAAGLPPKQFVDGIVESIKKLWALLDVDYDIYMRTTEDFHYKAVNRIFRRLFDQGDIYKGKYDGWYCSPCETFFTERQLKGGKCPDCGREVELISEEAYFFRLSRYQDRIIRHMEENPDFLQPKSRQNEMLSNFLKPGLEDLCVSRTSFKWGIPVDFDPAHVVYVWIDAVSNYISALGFSSEDDGVYNKYWPADVHFIGKDIVRFHAIIWPAILMALSEPLPKRIVTTGFFTSNGEKMSKSKGNAADPFELADKYGVDAVRYYALREMTFGNDADYTEEGLIGRINADLANDLGNLLSRTVGMIDKYFGGVLPSEQEEHPLNGEIARFASNVVAKTEALMDDYHISDALGEIWTLVRRMNKYADETQPWVLVKDEAKRPVLASVMYTLAESLRVLAVLISPFMPNTPAKIREQLNISDIAADWDGAKAFGLLPREVRVTKGEVVFPRIETKKDNAPQPQKPPKQPKTENAPETADGFISIDEFAKVKLRLGKVLACERVEGSDKLLKSQISIGSETRQIVSGIAKWYAPEDMVGKTVVVVANLKPVKLRGVLSEGMILAASDEAGGLSVITADAHGELEPGAEVR